jgi:choline dehydrogenase-like flavoprotein
MGLELHDNAPAWVWGEEHDLPSWLCSWRKQLSQYVIRYLAKWTILINIHPDSMIYSRGSSSDYDRYARVTNDPGWSWQNIQKYIKMVRDLASPQITHAEFEKLRSKKGSRYLLICTTSLDNLIPWYTDMMGSFLSVFQGSLGRQMIWS